VDLSQIELRAMAHLSGDRRLLRAFEEGDDVHAAVAHELLGAPKGKAHQDESRHRLPAKTINFGIINGMTEFGLLDQLHEQGQLHWTIDTVREMLTGWFKIHSGVDTYWKQQIAKAIRLGYVTDLFGARRAIGGVLSTSEHVRREAERQCLCPIQMTADRISKIWNRRIWRRILQPAHAALPHAYTEFWVRIHDDTTLEVDEARAKGIAARMLALVPQLLAVPTLAEAKVGQRWGSLASC
jgi:DNA polymerase-1